MKLIVVSNRVASPNAEEQAGGLTVALRDALTESGGVWFGWSGRSDGRESAPSVVREGGTAFATLSLSERDLDQYYRGYANSVVWPLFHERLNVVKYRERYRTSYMDVNAYFAKHLERFIDRDDQVWVQDYHLMPLGSELRKRGVRSKVGFFLHTPFPPYDVFRALPNWSEVLGSFMAYDLVGLQTPVDARNFADSMRLGLGARVDESAGTVQLAGRRMRYGAFPIGIDVERTAATAMANRDTPSARCLAQAYAAKQLVIGADRLDYTKGLVKRLHAFDRFLEAHGDEMEAKLGYIQIAAPSREGVERYQSTTRHLEAVAGRINGRNNRIGWTPLTLINRSIPRDELLGYFSLADVGLVTPLRDGMNLVAKEFLAAQPPEDPGVLVLSTLAGAAHELSQAAVLVNPYDAEAVAASLYRALKMPMSDRRRLWEIGMDSLNRNTARVWRDRFLDALSERGAWREAPRIAPRTPVRPRAPRRDAPHNGPTPTVA